jgi:hypothetical protein
METNPAADITGDFANQKQDYSGVWFLAGTFGGSATRSCTIPFGRGIFFPIITSAFSFKLDPDLKTESDLLMAAKSDMNGVTEMVAAIDDTEIDDLNKYRFRAGAFDDVVRGTPTREASDGYWLFLEPFRKGSHKIYFRAKNRDFHNEVMYNISIL